VLLKEMQSLALDVGVVSEEGQHTELRDEDDDLLRAAEELGIDLSGVRAPTGELSGEEVIEPEPDAVASGSEDSDDSASDDSEDSEDDGVLDVGDLIEDGISLELDGAEEALIEEPAQETET
jgi:DNA-directed RNA polymerase subunit beta